MPLPAVQTSVGTQNKALLAGRLLTAVALAVMAWIHLRLYSTYGYQTIPTIGGLFLANGIAGSVLSLAVLAVPTRFLGPTAFLSADLLLGTFIGFVVALRHPLFGFQDSITAPYAWTSLIDESVGAVIAIAVASASLRGRSLRAVARVWRRA